MITNWGYTLTDLDTLTDMLTVEEFNTFTGDRYEKNCDQVEKEIGAASAAIRNYVGWHLYPETACRMRTHARDRRITQVGNDILIQLPARVVTEVTAVTVGDTVCEDYFCEQNGLLRLYNVRLASRSEIITVDYIAGLSEGMMAPVQELIAHRVTHAVAVPAGITSEASGGVSVTYNANWINNSRATALVADNREVLIPYKVQGVF